MVTVGSRSDSDWVTVSQEYRILTAGPEDNITLDWQPYLIYGLTVTAVSHEQFAPCIIEYKEICRPVWLVTSLLHHRSHTWILSLLRFQTRTVAPNSEFDTICPVYSWCKTVSQARWLSANQSLGDQFLMHIFWIRLSAISVCQQETSVLTRSTALGIRQSMNSMFFVAAIKYMYNDFRA